MLARRFTIVCLIAMLFGIGFAMLVAEAGRANRRSPAVHSAFCQIPCPELVRH